MTRVAIRYGFPKPGYPLTLGIKRPVQDACHVDTADEALFRSDRAAPGDPGRDGVAGAAVAAVERWDAHEALDMVRKKFCIPQSRRFVFRKTALITSARSSRATHLVFLAV